MNQPVLSASELRQQLNEYASERRKRVLELRAQGMNFQEIAQMMGVSVLFAEQLYAAAMRPQ